jgi:hypothetical protein
LERALSEANFSTFLDRHPAKGIVAGSDWLDELHGALGRATCLLYLSSAASAASPWCQAELVNAYWSGKLVIPIQLDDTEPPLRQRVQSLDVRDSLDNGATRLLNVLRRRFPLSESSRPVTRTMNPYPGLRCFDEEEAELFFGRQDLADEIIRRLIAPRAFPEEFMVTITGASGSGKSSLVRGAVMPMLRVRHDGIRCVGPLEPEATLVETIRSAVRGSRLHAPSTPSETRGRRGKPEQLILVLDQAERLFTDVSTANPKAIATELEHLAEHDPWFRCLAVFRSDVGAGSDVDETFGRYLVRPVRVPVMRRDEMRQAIVEPAAAVGLRFEDGLVDRILDEVGGGQALPLLAYSLWNLAEMARDDRLVSQLLYAQSGGVRATLRGQAQGALDQLVRQGIGRDQALAALLRLVSVAPGGVPSARHVGADALNETEREALNAFVSRKLVIVDMVSDISVYQIAHEELLRWPSLADAIEQYRTDLLALEGLERKAEVWAGKENHDLLEGADLAHARYFDQRGLANAKLKALAEASRIAERPGFMTRVARPLVLFYGCILSFALLPWLIGILITIPFRGTEQLTLDASPPLGGALAIVQALVVYVLIAVEVLVYVLIVRRRRRISRYGYFFIGGGKCDARGYLARWLRAPFGILATPLSRCFMNGRLTWVDLKTGTELIPIRRDGSPRYAARAP